MMMMKMMKLREQQYKVYFERPALFLEFTTEDGISLFYEDVRRADTDGPRLMNRCAETTDDACPLD